MPRDGGVERRRDVAFAEGLHEVREHAGRDRLLDRRPVVERGQHDDRDRPLGVDAPRRLDPVEVRHAQVEQHRVRRGRARELDCLGAVPRLGAHGEAVPLEDAAQIETDQGLVFGDQNLHGAPPSVERLTKAASPRTS